MLRVILYFCFTLWSFCVLAKTDKEYYDKKGKQCEKEAAYTYRLYTKDDNGCLVTDHMMDGRMFMTGHIASFEERKNKDVWTGQFTYYWGDGKKRKEGWMLHGKQDSKWIFYTEAGDIQHEANYISGSVVYERYFSSNASKISFEHFYTNGVKDSSLHYYYGDNGNLNKVSRVVKGHYIAVRCYNSDGNVIPCAADDTGKMIYRFVEQMPYPLYNIQKYLSEHIIYPDSARIYGIEGRVMVQFIVEENGIITNAHVGTGTNAWLDSAAVDVIRNMPPWRPGKQNGKPVKVMYTQPISFRLEEDEPVNVKSNLWLPAGR